MNDPLAAAIVRTLNYADLFDYAMTPDEVFQFLIGVRTTRAEVDAVLNDHSRLNGSVSRVEGFLTLPQRQTLIAARHRLRAAAHRQFPRALIYARLLAHLPFVRMVALTGGLAMENARDNDIDYFIVTAPGRLWMVRGMAVALVRLARPLGDYLCPNYLLAENHLVIDDRNLYTAHEVVQMIPLYGLDVYRQMCALNQWIIDFLPNADGIHARRSEDPLPRVGGWFKQVAERMLGGALGDRVEHWEMKRKIAKLSLQAPQDADAVTFSEDACRGFFGGHERRVLTQFAAREQ
jgi:hypothetical protein